MDAMPYRLLESMDDLSCGDPNSPNRLIHGHNLEAPKALLPYYAAQGKYIAILPSTTLAPPSGTTTTAWNTTNVFP